MDGDGLWHLANELRDVLPTHALTERDGWELVSHMQVRGFRAGEVIYHRGDLAADAFVVHRGLVKSLLHDDEGRDLLVGLYGRGEFFGLLALFEPNATRETTVVAAMPTTALQVARADALGVLERNPQATRFLIRRFAQVIDRLSRLAEGIMFFDVPSRLAQFLLELERLPEPVRLTQEELAAAIGATVRTVNRTLADFAKRGLVSIERRQVRVLDETRLRKEIRSALRPE